MIFIRILDMHNDVLVAGLEAGLVAATAAKLPARVTGHTGETALSCEDPLIGVLLIKPGLFVTDVVVLFELEINIELAVLFIVVLDGFTAVGFMGYGINELHIIKKYLFVKDIFLFISYFDIYRSAHYLSIMKC